jgi:hypothetical protein
MSLKIAIIGAKVTPPCTRGTLTTPDTRNTVTNNNSRHAQHDNNNSSRNEKYIDYPRHAQLVEGSRIKIVSIPVKHPSTDSSISASDSDSDFGGCLVIEENPMDGTHP